MSSLLPKYIQTEIAMDFNLDHFKFSLPAWSGYGNASVRTRILTPHPTLSESHARISLAALHYGLTLYANGETRIELFHRVAKAAQGLANGQPSLTLDPWMWTLQTSRFTGLKSYQVWPWTLKSREDLVSPKVYVATLRARGDDLYVQLQISWHRTYWLGPSAALIHLYALSRDLDNRGQIILGKTLVAMNEYYGTAEGAGRSGQEVVALKSAMPVLLNDQPTGAPSPKQHVDPAKVIPREEEAKQEQLEEKEHTNRLSRRVEAFVKRFGRGSDREREHLIKLLTEEGLIAEVGDEPRRSVDIGLVENFITATVEAQERDEKRTEYDLFKRQLTATTQAAERPKSPGPSQEAIFLAMGQRADKIRVAYGKAMERKAKGYFRPESELPASKDKIKAAIVLTAWFYKSQGKLDKAMHDAYQVSYGHLADFVSEELAVRSKKEPELMSRIPDMHPGIDPIWLEKRREYHVLGEEYQRLAEEFMNLCDEFDRRLGALFDPLKLAKERTLIQQALLPESITPGGEHESS